MPQSEKIGDLKVDQTMRRTCRLRNKLKLGSWGRAKREAARCRKSMTGLKFRS